jgi:hypothetical protein
MDKPRNMDDLAMMYFRWMRDERVQKEEAWRNYYEQCFLAVDRAYNTTRNFVGDPWQPVPGFYECLTSDEKQLRKIVEDAGLGKREESGHFRTGGIWKYMMNANAGAIGSCEDKEYQEKADQLNYPADSDEDAEFDEQHKQKTRHIINFYLEGMMLLRNIYHAIQAGEYDTKAVIPKPLSEIPSPHVVRVKDEGKLELMFTALMSSLREDVGRGWASDQDLNEAGYPKLTPDE